MLKHDVEFTCTRDLVIDSKNKTFVSFNNNYKKFLDLLEKDDRSDDEYKEMLSYGKEAAIIVTNEFDLNDEAIKDKKREYIKFARDVFYENSYSPNDDADSMIFLIRALYGQSSIAYNINGEKRVEHFTKGNEWVDYLERNTSQRTLKAYALTLRAYIYIVFGKELSMTVEERVKKSEKDLIYATKWDETNYLAWYALGLIYLDSSNDKYDVNKALENFHKVLEFEKEEVVIDRYLNDNEKDRAMDNARRKISQLESH